MAALGTDIYLAEVVGSVNTLPDQVIPNQTGAITGLQFGGTEPLARLLGLNGVGPSVIVPGPDSGIVRFTNGSHGSLLDPAAQPEPSPAVTAEMQRQIATFLAGFGITVMIGSDVQDPAG